MYITKLTPELRDALYEEAISYDSKYLRHDKFNAVENYLREYYRIFLKGNYYYNNYELRFFANCPEYKKPRRRMFLHNYKQYFNGIIITKQLYSIINNDYLECPEVAFKRYYKARLMNTTMVRTLAILFDDLKHYSVFKLKYSEYL